MDADDGGRTATTTTTVFDPVTVLDPVTPIDAASAGFSWPRISWLLAWAGYE